MNLSFSLTRRPMVLAALLLAMASSAAHAGTAAELFPLQDVRLGPSPFLEAQATDLHYLMALEPDRLLAPYLREAGLKPKQPSYGNWESSGLDGHMGGHYLSALSLMFASTGNQEVKRRLDYFVSELKRAQDTNDGGDMRGYLGGIPGGLAAWREIAAGHLHADNFSVNGKWVPWYNLHKLFAGLRDAYRYTGNQDARAMLIKLSDWALALTNHLSDEQMQSMLKAEHGGMNEVLADVYQMTGDPKYLTLALRFSDKRILLPLEHQRDQLDGLHANTQIPKVIGFERIADLTSDAAQRRDMESAAEFFWQTVVENRTVAIGGNSVKEHFNPAHDFSSMIEDVEGPETCNTYNMLKLTEMLFLSKEQGAKDRAAYADYYERALYNHILASHHPDTGGFVYFTPMRPNEYRIYSQVDKAMWCCVGSGIESHAKYGEFIYAHDGDALFVNLFIPSTLNWREKNVRITQANAFPDQASTHLTVDEVGANARFTMKIRYPAWVAPGKLQLRVNGKPVQVIAAPGSYLSIDRAWHKGDRVDVELPMATHLEQMPDKSNYYAVLYGPIVLAAKTNPFPTEHLNFLADDSRMGHVPSGQVCPLESAPTFVSDSRDFIKRFRKVPGEALTFTAPAGLVQGRVGTSVEFIPFFRLHDSRYVVYWPQSTPGAYAQLRAQTAAREAEQLALDARTIDQVAPGEQQPEVDHLFKGEGADAGINHGRHWRHASQWFSYQLRDPKQEAKLLRLTFARADAGRRFDILVNGQPLAEVELSKDEADEFYTRDFELPASLVKGDGGKLEVKFVAKPGSMAGGLYGLRLMR